MFDSCSPWGIYVLLERMTPIAVTSDTRCSGRHRHSAGVVLGEQSRALVSSMELRAELGNVEWANGAWHGVCAV